MWPHPHLIGRGRLLWAPPATAIPADLDVKVPLGAFDSGSGGTNLAQPWNRD